MAGEPTVSRELIARWAPPTVLGSSAAGLAASGSDEASLIAAAGALLAVVLPWLARGVAALPAWLSAMLVPARGWREFFREGASWREEREARRRKLG